MSDTGRKSSLIMIELMSAMLIFSICCAICVGLYVEADRESKNSARLTQAVFLAQNAAELLNGDYEKNLTSVLNMKATDNVYTAQYDENWQPTSETGHYVLIITVDAQKGIADILVTEIGTEVYRISAGIINLNGGNV
ncbi:MAG TPA: hypothetical protein PK629_08185 [Oscillospiraceae bacterium]|nr:hypothetical protein [Oscillospiraceae bacterium]HPF55816.1 hypothetical protein [Clostridiales bacterium]HPK35437.1 hypothetical protein [Oscillospiraceae bacterium]HPR75161.1 hypothetical protein [Oscillospiraceae bacterium]